MRLIIFLLLTGIVVYTLISCSFSNDDPSLSSSSVTKIPNSSSSKIPNSSSSKIPNLSSSSIDCSIINSSSTISEDLCYDFDPDAEIKHYGKMKKQFCDKRDGKKYVYVQIGEQTWMAENLNYVTCGSKCGSGGNYSSLEDANTENCDKFGRLYDWYTALTICPDGWHLPSGAEWAALTDYAGDSAGIKLRATSVDWICIESAVLKPKLTSYMTSCICCDNYKEGTDDYGFSALPGGYGSSNTGYFYVGQSGHWWSNIESQGYGSYWTIHDDSSDVSRFGTWKTNFLSVRCVKDYSLVLQ